jgi:hypothetical protein
MSRSFILAALALVLSGTSHAQEVQMNERAAKEAVWRIVQHSGLLPNFDVRQNTTIRTAIAYIKDRKRVIEYNPEFISTIIDSSRTDWSAVSVLAHEIAHHLLGHTLDPGELHPGDELACDRYSGFILYAMGATMQESLAAIEVAGDPHGTQAHPPKQARVAAIQQGWEDAQQIGQRIAPTPFTVHEDLQFTVRLAGDDNTYYVDAQDRVVWFDNYSKPIEFGLLTRLPKGEYTYGLTWGENAFLVDGRLNIWRRTETQMMMKVGTMAPYASASDR